MCPARKSTGHDGRALFFFLFFSFSFDHGHFFFPPHCATYEILVPRPGIKPGPSAVKTRSPNHWTASEFPMMDIFKHTQKERERERGTMNPDVSQLQQIWPI